VGVGNTVRGSRVGILGYASSESNLVVGNTLEAIAEDARDLGIGNAWDDGTRGNYWSALRGSDTDGDGILDAPYPVPPRGVDRYPLARPPASGP